jgi:hypothetical protein
MRAWRVIASRHGEDQRLRTYAAVLDMVLKLEPGRVACRAARAKVVWTSDREAQRCECLAESVIADGNRWCRSPWIDFVGSLVHTLALSLRQRRRTGGSNDECRTA